MLHSRTNDGQRSVRLQMLQIDRIFALIHYTATLISCRTETGSLGFLAKNMTYMSYTQETI